MKSVIKTSKTVEEAVKEALLELDALEEDVEVDVIEEPSKGLFGIIGSKEAKVRVTVKNDPIDIADRFLKKIMGKMGIEATNNIEKIDDLLKIDIDNIDPVDMGILIGKRGNTLDSIQYLLSLAVNKNRSNYLRVVIDSEGYRAKREETLVRLAHKMAEKVKYSRRPVKLEPMNPFERRIIHSTLQNIQGIVTYSEGEEPFRRVVITSK